MTRAERAPRRNTMWGKAAGAFLFLVLSSYSMLHAAQVIDRVLAVVAGQPITLSDVRGAITFGLAPGVPAGEDVEQSVLNSLIDRQLQLLEVNRYLPPEPTGAEMDARLAAIRARFQSEAAFQAALTETGLSPDLLRALVRDNIRIENYLSQRFGMGIEPTEEDIQRYARSADFKKNGVDRPYAEVREEAKRRLTEARRAALIRDWIAGVKRRVDVAILTR